ncbi:hypothetical protein [Ignatzschineria sp. F8392]|uniref:hypothetical protein n=1 Tax=Ignatzschineria sp. F8392 TaxID=1980117 RepID=UPI00117B8CB9|nr:hypothetical protein [Ignatzschineria sp. F8392]
MSGFFILKKVRGAAGTHYFILITSACPQFGHFQCPLPARSFLEECDSKIRQLISLCCFN